MQGWQVTAFGVSSKKRAVQKYVRNSNQISVRRRYRGYPPAPSGAKGRAFESRIAQTLSCLVQSAMASASCIALPFTSLDTEYAH
jgi:hypothetical protein